ncbi:MAG: hypothetical protein MUF34_12335 [Polyangiaceae bacterium]|nr:hypothetical protein [Polyangiaceae bacterium]
MTASRPKWWRRGVGAVLGAGAILGGCNSLLGIEDASVTPGTGGGNGGAGGSQGGDGGSSGATGGRAGQGASGGSAGASGSAGSGQAGNPSGPFDTTFGNAGVVLTDVGAVLGGAVTVVDLGQQRGKVFLAGEVTPPPATAGAGGSPPDPDSSDLFFARFGEVGQPDPTFGGFLSTPGRVTIDSVDNLTNHFNAISIDPNVESVVFTHYTENSNSKGAVVRENRNARLLADGSEFPGFFPRSYFENPLEPGSTEVLVPHDPGTDPGYLVVRCHEYIDFQQFELWRFTTNGTLDATVSNTIGQMPTRVSCSTRPARAPDGNNLCIALASRDQSTPDSARVGTACLRTAGTNTITVDAKYGSAGTFLFRPPALDPLPDAFTVQVYALAFDAQNRIYESFRAGSHTFIVRLLADGTNVDATFGGTGVVDLGGGEVTPWCLQVDAAGSVLWGSTAGGVSRVRRFASDGTPAPGFGLEGVELPATFTPQRCMIDAADRLVVAGPSLDPQGLPGGAPTVTLMRLLNN